MLYKESIIWCCKLFFFGTNLKFFVANKNRTSVRLSKCNIVILFFYSNLVWISKIIELTNLYDDTILNVVYFSFRFNLLTLHFHRPLWWSCLPLTCMVNSFPSFPGLSEPAIVLGKPKRASGVVLHLRRIYMSLQKLAPFNTAWLQIYSTIWCSYKRVLWRSVAPREKKSL